jgi:mono/diheme cytochrome c family protein
MLKRVLQLLMLLAAAGGLPAAEPKPVPADHARQMAAGLELFKGGVGDLLKEHCLNCHGGEKTKGDFDLATREGLLKGGAEGIAVVAGSSGTSRLMKLLQHTEEPFMPSKKPKLPEPVIRQIAAWIDAGAPYAQPLVAGAKVVKDRSAVSDQDRQFWSFQPLQRPTPPAVKNKAWVRTPIDQFVLAKQEEKGLKPNAPIDRRKLIRRATFDLIGLPPTPEEIEAFVKDKSTDAYEKLIDRLLASPHYGERWGRHWLDLARFGESHGYEQDYDRKYAYHYRDFVIEALNQDLPYDQFVKWQIAGDELAPDNALAWKATGFLAAGTHATQITANQAEKERYDELDDMTATIGTSMLGLTIGCARCHDHKFDPIPTADYYRMISTFTTTVRSDFDIDQNPVKTREALAAFNREHAPLVAALGQFEKEQLPGRVEQWLAGSPKLAAPPWLGLEADKFQISGVYYGINKQERQADGSYLVSVTAGTPDTYVFTTKTTLTNISALRLEALADKSLPSYGPGWSKEGDFNMTEFTVTVKPLKGEGKPVTLKFAGRRATNDKPETSAAGGAARKKSATAWSTGGNPGKDATLVFDLEEPAGFPEGTELTVTMKFTTNLDRQNLGRFRLALSTATAPALDADAIGLKDFDLAQKALTTAADKRSAAQKAALAKLYCATDADWRKLHHAVQAHAKKEPRPTLIKALVSSEGLPAIRLHTQGPDFYDKTFLLRRGDLAQKQNEIPAGFMQVLMRAPETKWRVEPPTGAKTSQRRAALANWITDTDAGGGTLLARVMVNRLWQHHFGKGIVTTPSDFGNMGERPSHPELLDWLAGELIRQNWKLKPVHKLIMTSAAYVQGGQTDDKRMKLDPDNKWIWHREPQRLEAEIIRDSLLATTGRLDKRMFGPGSLDEGQLRRSIYFTIKRSKMIPMMTQFDAPDSLQSLGLRVNTTVAPQALLMLNNPQVRASAQEFARRLKPKAEKSLADAVQSAYETALGRPPDKTELADSVGFLKQQIDSYGKAAGMEPALADFCQAVLGLNEFIYVE